MDRFFPVVRLTSLLLAVALGSGTQMNVSWVKASDDAWNSNDLFEEAPSPFETGNRYANSLDPVVYSEEYWDAGLEEPNDAGQAGAKGTFTESVPELVELKQQLAELQKTTDELKSDFAAEQKKNKKEDKTTDPFKVKFGGHLSIDAVNISQNDESRALLGNTYNSVDIRDLRVSMTGSGHGSLQYKAVIGVNDSVKIYDAYLRLKDTQYFGDVTIGNFFVESGMESTTVTFDRVFTSLDEGANMFRMNRHLGVSSTYFSEDKKSRAMFGAFLAPSISSSPHYSCDNDPGLILNTRWTTAPVLNVDDDGFTREVFHLGASYFWLCPGGETNLKLRTRGQMWNGSNPYFINGTVSLADRSYGVAQAEAAYQKGEFATTVDGFVGSVYDGGGSAFGTTVTARCFLTPHCSRSYVTESARFGSIKTPEEHVFLNYKERTIGKNWGALEAVAKWEWTDTNNLKDVQGALYGITNRVVAGANWFWNDQTFMALNWEHAMISANKNSKHSDLDFDTIIAQMTFKF